MPGSLMWAQNHDLTPSAFAFAELSAYTTYGMAGDRACPFPWDKHVRRIWLSGITKTEVLALQVADHFLVGVLQHLD